MEKIIIVGTASAVTAWATSVLLYRTLDIYCDSLSHSVKRGFGYLRCDRSKKTKFENGNKTKQSATQSTRSLVNSLENVLWVEVSSMRAFSQVHPTPFVSVVPCLSSVSLLVWSSKITVFQVATDSQVFVVDGSLHYNVELSKANSWQMKTRAHARKQKKILPNMIVKW